MHRHRYISSLISLAATIGVTTALVLSTSGAPRRKGFAMATFMRRARWSRRVRWSVTVLAVALGASGAIATPALAAPVPAAHMPTAPVAQTVTPNTEPASVNPATNCYNGGYITLTDGSVMDAKSFDNPAQIIDFN